MATTKKRRSFCDSVKSYGRNYKSDIEKAYDIGYSRGWEDAYNIPKRPGARTAAAVGYRNGVKNRPKSDKYTKHYKR